MKPGYVMQRDRWVTRAGEWVLFALAWTWRAITWPVPTWLLSGAMGWLGAVVALGVPAFRRRLEGNIAHVHPEMPPGDRRRLARGAAREFTALAVEYAQFSRFARQVRIEAQGLDRLVQAVAGGRGAVLVTAHYGNWEIARLAAKRAGVEVGIIYRPFNNRYLDRFTLDLIAQAGEPVLHKGRKGMRALRQHVAGGGAALILVDQRTSGAPFLDFLGRPAETVTVAADLARKTGAALIPVVARRDRAARCFHVRVESAIPAADPLAMTQAVNDRIGAWIAEAPEQWFWFHRRWKTTRRSRTDQGEQP